MKKYLIAILLLAALENCSAQIFKIKKAVAFYSISIPGMAHTDINGNRINPKPITERQIYFETNYKSKPNIDSILYNGIAYTGTLDTVKDTIITVGINSKTGKPIILIPQKGNSVWVINLNQPTNEVDLSNTSINTIILKCKLGKNTIKQVITKEVQLNTPDRY